MAETKSPMQLAMQGHTQTLSQILVPAVIRLHMVILFKRKFLMINWKLYINTGWPNVL